MDGPQAPDEHLSRLMARAQEGDSDAYVTLLRAITPRIRQLVRSKRAFLAASDVADVVQEALLTSGTLGASRETDWPCVASMAIGAFVLGGPLVWMLRRGAPLTPRTTALLAGSAALSFANIEACVTRPHAFAMTVLLWHGGTITLVVALFAGMGRRWLRWPVMIPR